MVVRHCWTSQQWHPASALYHGPADAESVGTCPFLAHADNSIKHQSFAGVRNPVETTNRRNNADAWQDLAADAPQAIRDALEPAAARAAEAEGEPVRIVLEGASGGFARAGRAAAGRRCHAAAGRLLAAGSPVGLSRFLPRPRAIVDAAHRRAGRCIAPAGRQWGWATQLYAARSAESWGIGDLADLRRLAAWAASLRANLLLLNPLGAYRAPSCRRASARIIPAAGDFSIRFISAWKKCPARSGSGGDWPRWRPRAVPLKPSD